MYSFTNWPRISYAWNQIIFHAYTHHSSIYHISVAFIFDSKLCIWIKVFSASPFSTTQMSWRVWVCLSYVVDTNCLCVRNSGTGIAGVGMYMTIIFEQNGQTNFAAVEFYVSALNRSKSIHLRCTTFQLAPKTYMIFDILMQNGTLTIFFFLFRAQNYFSKVFFTSKIPFNVFDCRRFDVNAYFAAAV